MRVKLSHGVFQTLLLEKPAHEEIFDIDYDIRGCFIADQEHM